MSTPPSISMPGSPPPPLKQGMSPTTRNTIIVVAAVLLLLLLLLLFWFATKDGTGNGNSTASGGGSPSQGNESNNQESSSSSSAASSQQQTQQSHNQDSNKSAEQSTNQKDSKSQDESRETKKSGTGSADPTDKALEIADSKASKASSTRIRISTDSNTIGLGDFTGDAQFFGIEGNASRLGFVIDHSNSMRGAKLALAKRELIDCIDGLTDKQEFDVIMYASQWKAFNQSGLTKATDRTKQQFRQWIGSIRAAGGTRPEPAMKEEIDRGAAVIFLLSDGEFHLGFANEIIDYANEHNVVVHCISLVVDSTQLRRIAAETKGEYVHIPN